MLISSEYQIDLKLNHVTKAQYLQLRAEGKIKDDQLYLMTDDTYALSSDISNYTSLDLFNTTVGNLETIINGI